MKLSIGILAWNEEESIGQTIASLFEQSLFTNAEHFPEALEVICVPNGCADNTAAAAKRAFDVATAGKESTHVDCRVCEVQEAGKSNAWNRFTHDFSRSDADFFILMDADIWFNESQTLRNMLHTLQNTPAANVAVDIPLKHVHFKDDKSAFDKVSLSASELTLAGPPAIAGSLYCGRSEVFKRIWMPVGLPVEDGFLRAMIITDLFTSDVNEDRIVRAPDASHVFTAYTGVREIFRHEKRLAIGSAMNAFLCWHYLQNRNGEGDAGRHIKELMDADPEWYPKFIRDAVARRGWWVMPWRMAFDSFTALAGMPWTGALRRLPTAVARFAFNLAVMAAANRDLKKSDTAGFW